MALNALSGPCREGKDFSSMGISKKQSLVLDLGTTFLSCLVLQPHDGHQCSWGDNGQCVYYLIITLDQSFVLVTPHLQSDFQL